MDFKGSKTVKQIKNNVVAIHVIIGIVVGYFLLHPITMVIYLFESNTASVTFNNILNVFAERFTHAFYLHMMPMSVAFAVIGGLTGLSSGLNTRKIQKQHRKIQSQSYQLSENIQTIIRNGENEKVEFKSSLRWDFKKGQPNKALEEVVMKSIAGLMNSNGGILIIGVDDNGCLLGLFDDYSSLKRQNRDGFEQRLMQTLSSRFGADICSLVHVTFHQVTDLEICSVYIEKANRPMYIHEGENAIFYLRTGNITKPLNTQETVEYLKTKEIKSKHLAYN